MVAATFNDIHFGGPNLPSGKLRDLLADRISQVPFGGAIDWVTYYYRDRRLAEELLRAQRRGVKVTVTLEGRPRTVSANDAVIAMLDGPDGLGRGFRTVSLRGIPISSGKQWKPHLHEKLYYFSHPKPVVYIGSFNPSGDDPEEEPEIINEIGDQDRGHNALVGLYDPAIVKCLRDNARWLSRTRHYMFHRFSFNANCKFKGGDTDIHFWPRVRPHPILHFLRRIGPGANIRIAASHIKGTRIAKALIGLVHRGANLEVLADPTLRRVPAEIEQMLLDAGIKFQRLNHSCRAPMHNKFVLAEINNQRWVIFGSFNWTTRSYWLNYEIGAISANRHLFDAFADRWEAMSLQAD